MDSRPFVVFSDRPNRPYTPSDATSGSRRGLPPLPAADCSDPPAHADWRAARASSYSGRLGVLETLPPHRCSRQVTHHVLTCATDTVAPGRGGGRLSAPAPCRHPRSPAAPGRPRGPARPKTGGSTPSVLRVRLDEAQEPSPVIVMPIDDHRRLGTSCRPARGPRRPPRRGPAPELAEFRRAGLNKRVGHRRPRQAVPRTTAGESRSPRHDAAGARESARAGRPTRPSRGC